ncbi:MULTISPECIES: HlyD family type I secretion periplasmic adaptor subunit [unclassified Undibacterium]|uniref:HlyD family type I secretion periplasmic adaptor subunit n=1 Tax=unclassified Undibacterium TaxID=2630295 RepID=UPI002AC8A6C0|nr:MULTISPECIES: HlyD family type I secretion periplasmic adaptor subunit [unclassified Undibacterium]MEB0140018.1 HlyD family type I secretion periplasmic adaptor subunit [Undibacterium sp. CCC2.1]MEB0173069.1 HlyD family type I secretion periplasmic adaptor subunit [Undibacterium sp. CCC1.1]MEB0176881.1 HlyD family type I secretion periplasmic adaptor subunit [Undibacterium sp. CCC3.4]MEB0216113.1 HlyD family type I secretion periplasmic adaptor subunit [Undibacterium sp. 5I2]WPX42004.1 HlyD
MMEISSQIAALRTAFSAWRGQFRFSLGQPARRAEQRPGLRAGDAAFIDDIQDAMMAQSPTSSSLVLYLVALVMLSGLVWAYFARVEEVTRGNAKIISKSREQVVQSVDGGILVDLKVREGQVVEKGEILLKIDPTRANAAYREGLSKKISLKADIARLKAEAYRQPLQFPDDVAEHKAVVQQQTLSYQSRRQALEQSIAAVQNSYELVMNELTLTTPLAERGLISQVEILRMQRQANDLRTQMTELRNRFQADANTELGRAEAELDQTEERVVGQADMVTQATVLAQVRGTVKNVRVSSLGAVIQPGEVIMEIIPLEDQLLVEAKIKPGDIAFLTPGLAATVKISAYDYGVYGGLKGTLQHISPDTFNNEQRVAGAEDETYYRALVLTEHGSLEAGGKSLPIIPGMTATVEIRTGEKTILDYLLKPILKAREAFRER